jgi:hypothetical protein
VPASKRKIDMTNVKDGSQFNSKHMPEGDYAAIVVDVMDQESKNGNDMWVYTIKLKDYPRAVYAYYCVLEEKSLFKIRHLFTAAGIDIPRKLAMIDPNRIIGKEIGVGLEDDEYDGNIRSKITAVMELEDMTVNNSAPELDDEEEELDEAIPARKEVKAAVAKRTRKPAPVVEEEDDEEEEDEVDEEPEPPRRTRKAAPVRKAARRAPVVEDDDDEEDDDEDEPEPPRKTRKAAPRTRATSTRRKRPAPVEDDEDEDEIDLDDL